LKQYARFENVDVIDTLRKIMQHNTEYYQTDFEYDIRQLTDAAEVERGPKGFLWASRKSGTLCYAERNVFIQDISAHNSWCYYIGSPSERLKAFWIKLGEMQDKTVMGNIVELDYEAHVKEVKRVSHSPTSVDVVFRNPNSVRNFGVKEYNEARFSFLANYGTMNRIEHQIDNEYMLKADTDNVWNACYNASAPAVLDAYVREMELERFHDYGYLRDDKVFTTVDNAEEALRHGLRICVLNRDGSEMLITNHEELIQHHYSGDIFGMSREEKTLLDYLTAHPSASSHLFTQEELRLMYALTVEAGTENKAEDLRVLDSIVYKLERVLPLTQEAVIEMSEEIEQGLEV
jgi:hypothetical protein